MNTASWTIPRTPIPRTLPVGSQARTVDSTTSTTRLCFSLTTPVRTVKTEAEDADEDQDRSDVGDQELRLVLLGLRLERRGLGRPLRVGERRLVDVAPAEDGLDAQGDGARPAMTWAVALVRLALDPDLAGAGQVGRHVDDDLGATVVESRVGGRRIAVGRDRDLLVEALTDCSMAVWMPGWRRLDHANLGRVVATEHDGRDHKQPTTMSVHGEGHAEIEVPGSGPRSEYHGSRQRFFRRVAAAVLSTG